MHSGAPLHIDVQDGDVPLMASSTAGKVIALLPNPSVSNVMALITTRGFAIWNSSDTPTIEKDILKDHPEADPLSLACWGHQGSSLFLVSGSTIIEFDCASSQIELRFQCPVRIVFMGWWGPQGILVVITEDKHISFFDFSKEKSLVHQLETKGYPSLADLNPNQNALAIVENESASRQFISIIELQSCQVYTRFECPTKQQVTAIAIATNGRRVAIGTEGGELISRSFNLRDEPRQPEYYETQSGVVGSLNETKAHKGPIRAIAWSQKKEFLIASVGHDGAVTLYNSSSRKNLGSKQICNWPIMSAAFMNEYLTLSIGGYESTSNPEDGPFTLLKAVPSKFGK